MKKYRIYIILSCLIVVLTFTIFLASCGTKNISIFRSNLSEVRYNYYVGTVSGYKVNFTAGLREKEYKLNGYHTENIEFGILTIILPDDVEYNGNATYRIDYGNKTKSGSLEQNPFDLSLMADIGFIIQNFDEIKVTFKMGDITKIFTLIDVTRNFTYDYNIALEMFVSENYDELKPFISKSELKAEVYLKIMADDTIDSGYYYLIRVIGRNGRVVSGIVNPTSGEILAVQTSTL